MGGLEYGLESRASGVRGMPLLVWYWFSCSNHVAFHGRNAETDGWSTEWFPPRIDAARTVQMAGLVSDSGEDEHCHKTQLMLRSTVYQSLSASIVILRRLYFSPTGSRYPLLPPCTDGVLDAIAPAGEAECREWFEP
jgi:hypothetical protein